MTWDSRQLAQQTGRTFVVTGANSGIGLEAARDLVSRGAHVVLAVRDTAKGERARSTLVGPGTSSVVELDVSDLDSVASAAKTLSGEHSGLHALVCNAGIMGGPYLLTTQGIERQMATNHLGHAALVTALWPLLHSAGGRVVVVSSLLARGGRLTAQTTREELVDPGSLYDGMQVYRNTKQANLLFALELHRRSSKAGSPVGAVAVHPGVSATNLLPRQLDEAGSVLAPLSKLVTKVALQSASAGALPTLRALDHSTPSGSFLGPARFGQVRGRPELLEPYASASDPAVAAHLWDLTEDVLGAPLPV
jgi:protochlorophyllide reductase